MPIVYLSKNIVHADFPQFKFRNAWLFIYPCFPFLITSLDVYYFLMTMGLVDIKSISNENV